MKNITRLKHILSSLFLIVSVIACNQNKTSNSDASQQTDTTTYKLVSFYKTSSECGEDTCGAYVKAVYPEFKEKELNNFVMSVITPKPFDSTAHADLKIVADSFINEYLNFRKEFPDAAGGYQWEQNLKVSHEDKKVISFTHFTYSYTGGAHGLESIAYHNLSKPSYLLLTLDDLLKEGYHSELLKVAEKIFRKDENLEANTSLSDNYFFENNKFSLNNNFLITPEGLLFTYNPYEIKAYAFGSTDLLIPYNEIKDLIKPNGILSDFY